MLHSYEAIQAHCKDRLSSHFDTLHFIAYSEPFLPEGKDTATISQWEDAIGKAHRSIVGLSLNEAEKRIRTEAAKVLGDPAIISHFDRRAAAEARAAAAQAEADQIAQEEQTARHYAEVSKQAEARRAHAEQRWGRDWNAEIEAAKETIRQLYPKQDLSGADQARLIAALNSITHLRTLQELAADRHPD